METAVPNRSSAASPSISAPTCVHAVPFQSKTLACPEFDPFPSFRFAPTTIRSPAPFMETEFPKKSPAASPFMVDPILVQLPLLYSYTSTLPAAEPGVSSKLAPITILLPSLLMETDHPK